MYYSYMIWNMFLWWLKVFLEAYEIACWLQEMAARCHLLYRNVWHCWYFAWEPHAERWSSDSSSIYLLPLNDEWHFCLRFTEHLSNQTLLAFFQSSKDQRLVYSGRLLQDHLQLRDVLRKVQSCSLICLNIKSDAVYKNKSSDLKRSLMLLQTVWVFLIVEMLETAT